MKISPSHRIPPKVPGSRAGFSLVEILLVVAVIAVISSILIPYFSPIRRAASGQVARQQQAELQTALSSWVIAQSGGPGGLAAARATYNSAAGSRLQLLQNYLQVATYSLLSFDGGAVTSTALDSMNAYLQFSDWAADGQPTVQWVNR
jgi:prepilin-type N-terminal cleavage/methylation domain-containing protein